MYETDCCFVCRDARVLDEERPFVVERVLGSAETDRCCELSRRRLLERPLGIAKGGGIDETSLSPNNRLFFRAEPGCECPFIDIDSISPLVLGRLRDDRPCPLCEGNKDAPSWDMESSPSSERGGSGGVMWWRWRVGARSSWVSLAFPFPDVLCRP